MRYKALSDDYSKNVNKKYYVSYTISFILVIILALMSIRQYFKPGFDPKSLIWIFIPYAVLAIPNSFFLIISAAKRNIVRLIGTDRYITLNKDELILEDKNDGRYIKRSYTWDSIENVIIKNNTHFNRFNKNKTYTVTFILNQAEYNYFLVSPKFKTPDKINHVDSFFTVMHSRELVSEINNYWNGTIEELPHQSR